VTSVAFHVDQLFYKVPGGIGSVVRETLQALRRVDPALDITLFHARFGRAPEDWTREFRTVGLSQGIRTLYPSWALTGRPVLPETLASADVVHAPSSAAVPPTGRGQRLVVHVHDLAFLRFPSLFPSTWRVLFRLGLRRAARSADAVIVPSGSTAADLERLTDLAADRIHVVPHGVTLPQIPVDPRGPLGGIEAPRPYVLFVGTLEPRKNLVRLVRAYRRAAASGEAPHALILAGPIGWNSEPLHRELRAPGAGRVILTGEVSAEDLDALYRGASAFVYPSLYEGFGLPVLEAMARGIPVIASSTSSLPEVAGDAAILVDPRSVEGLAEAIGRLLTDRAEAERLAAAGRARAESYSWERTARQTLAVYRGVIAG
jgi:glycosyltransferase involved in cell wall biosynthesis